MSAHTSGTLTSYAAPSSPAIVPTSISHHAAALPQRVTAWARGPKPNGSRVSAWLTLGGRRVLKQLFDLVDRSLKDIMRAHGDDRVLIDTFKGVADAFADGCAGVVVACKRPIDQRLEHDAVGKALGIEVTQSLICRPMSHIRFLRAGIDIRRMNPKGWAFNPVTDGAA